MGERRPTNSELRRQRRLAEEEQETERRGILELFDDAAEEPKDEDAPLARDPDEHDS